ncbi:single-stranded DNA-binding protein [Clostridium tertium]|jgi:single-strand DNA-binding protein|uniref:single-stranded DNA-binding protein n=1 Tax=Clostridium tertium TaxID=1559 RepID=UPI001C1E69E5|nr:single-stranded DNA-binding protein [Clostridium tertium]MBU6137327.1 single-stranded DNA-binding protein [Clostridium tertium]
MNKWVGIGRLTRDPELNFAAGTGTAVARFTLAVTRPFKKDETDFINCIAFNKRAEAIAQYLTKGRQLAVTGSIRTGSYDAKDGTKRYTTDIVVDSFEFIGSNKNDNQGNTPQNNFGGMNFEDDMTPVDDGDMPF